MERVEKVKIEDTWNDIGVYAAKGKRSKMEDTFMAYENAWGTGASFFGVFDGHTGTYAASYARDRLMKNIVNRVADLKSLMGSPIEPDPYTSEQTLVIGSVKKGCHEADPYRWRWEKPKSESKRKRHLNRLKPYLEVGGIIDYQMFLRDVFKSTDLDLCASARKREFETGTTALVAIIDGSQLIVANVGDSRGVMCDSNGDPVPLSFDQKPDRKDEAERLEKAGGRISCDDGGITRLNDCFAISRSLGDQAEKLKHQLIPDPEVFIFDLSKYKPKFIVLATDGLYHHLTNDQVVAFIHQRLHEDDLGAKSLDFAPNLAKMVMTKTMIL
ncbi:protein phosphatase 1L isoform X2 [Bemisia tabaci]|uniref:protein phosphatase 1L isoform X2 n=1 Tax=Bemisia tabaci TaxID=7038 RepID=UPI003B280BA0